MTHYGVILFYTTSSALKAEKTLIKQGLEVKLIPVPRELSSDCGISLRFNWKDRELVLSQLTSENVEIDSIHRLE